MEKIKRDVLLEKGFSEEQTSVVLDLFHSLNSESIKENEDLKKQIATQQSKLETANTRINELEGVESEYNQLRQSQLTAEEKLKLKEEEIAKKYEQSNLTLSKANKIYNKAKAKEILSGVGQVDEELLNALISDDEQTTITRATALRNQLELMKETTEKSTTERLSSIDTTPSASTNLNQNSVMTWEKFSSLSADEQSRFAEEHPDEFANI